MSHCKSRYLLSREMTSKSPTLAPATKSAAQAFKDCTTSSSTTSPFVSTTRSHKWFYCRPAESIRVFLRMHDLFAWNTGSLEGNRIAWYFNQMHLAKAQINCLYNNAWSCLSDSASSKTYVPMRLRTKKHCTLARIGDWSSLEVTRSRISRKSNQIRALHERGRQDCGFLHSCCFCCIPITNLLSCTEMAVQQP